MTITIYGDRISGNCLKVKWVAERLSVPYRWIDVDVVKGEAKTPEFLLINPAGQVPAQPGPGGEQRGDPRDVTHGLREQRVRLAAFSRSHLPIGKGLSHVLLSLLESAA